MKKRRPGIVYRNGSNGACMSVYRDIVVLYDEFGQMVYKGVETPLTRTYPTIDGATGEKMVKK
ncbi:MAG: hypothetical protein GY841_22460 [FCB group bacterium]|nr:hypothetical protein [FCB group bacterium]